MGKEKYIECIEALKLEMLEILGRSYIIEHCVAFLKNKAHEESFRNYVTDCLKMIAENTANAHGGTAPSARYCDLINPQAEETRTEEEIINSIKDKLRKL